ncbi:MAG: 3'(2'),5'-bisphosphate nucleotidase CysQ [Alphaproteobacteria bacterium]|nr:3'(2'),5'-bisphosphate nucleotidase CysQ [Alphaproteobacteria bacterium]
MDRADADLLSEAARAAGAVLLEWRARGAKVWNKGGTPVTEADHASNALLHDHLRGARPDYGWLSEETLDDPARLALRKVFVVDPLDGTVSFIKGKDDFTVAVAVVEDGRPVAAAVYNPVRDEMYEAALGGGAWRNGTALKVGAPAAIENCRMIAAKDMFQHPAWPQKWPPMDFLKIGSIAYRLALVAADVGDATVALSTKSDWDIAAGELIAAEAGARVSAHDGSTFVYNRRSTHQRSLLAAPQPLYDALSARLAPIKLPSSPTE